MKILEITIYSVLATLISYALLSLGLRYIMPNDIYTAHMIAGIACVVIGVGMFMFLILTKSSKKTK